MASNRQGEIAEEPREPAQLRSPSMDTAREILAQPYDAFAFRSWILANTEAIRAQFRQTPDSDRTKAMWSTRRSFESLDASTTKNLDRIKDKVAAVKLLTEIDAWENDHAVPEEKRNKYKRMRKERKKAEKAFAEAEREAKEKIAGEAVMQEGGGIGRNGEENQTG